MVDFRHYPIQVMYACFDSLCVLCAVSANSARTIVPRVVSYKIATMPCFRLSVEYHRTVFLAEFAETSAENAETD
jgi:hypothetical protein